MKRLAIFLCFLAAFSSARADTFLIRQGDLYTASGVKPATDILVRDGMIAAVGPNLSTPGDATVIDAADRSITAGLFNAQTGLGLVEVGAIEQTRDYATTNSRYTASLKVADAYNPNSTLIAHNRIHGLTHAVIVPWSDSGIFAGQAAIVHLGLGHQTVIDDSAAVLVTLDDSGVALAGGSRAAALAQLREALEDARDYQQNEAAVNAGQRRAYTLSLPDLKVVQEVLAGKPLIAVVHRAADIRALLKLAAEFNLNLILSGASEGWMVADEIAAANVTVIPNYMDNLPNSYETLGARLDNAALLRAAGVNLMLMGMSRHQTHNAYLIRQAAGNAVANGLDYTAAIAAMTLNPARVFGLTGVGDIAPGFEANLVIWSGSDPLALDSEAERVFIKGKAILMVSRSTQLRDKYFKRLQQH